MRLLGLCIGINAYGQGADLEGCVNDASDWSATLAGRGFDTTCLTDADATKAAIVSEMQAVVDRAGHGDTVVVTYSGHGTWVPDADGDESDGRDEAICPAGVMDDGEVITDDELYMVFSSAAPGARVVFVSDSCHSGTVARLAGPLVPKEHARRARFLPPSMFLHSSTVYSARTLIPRAPLRGIRYPALLLSGCADPEYSYDTYFETPDGWRANGAFTRTAISTLAMLSKPGAAPATYRAWHAAIRAYLPSIDYPQTPGLVGTTTQKSWTALA